MVLFAGNQTPEEPLCSPRISKVIEIRSTSQTARESESYCLLTFPVSRTRQVTLVKRVQGPKRCREHEVPLPVILYI